MRGKLLLYLVISFSASIFGQKEIVITGTVKDIQSNPLSYIDIIIKQNDSLQSVVAYAITDEFGRYRIIYQTKFNNLLLETSSLVHRSYTKTFALSKKSNRFVEDIILTPRVEELEEVEVRATPRVQIKNDTTNFNLNKLLDGSERIVEEILTKLPGITIKENGRLKFKGKDVKNILLDGDNLFNGNYTIGTKNINAEHIIGVQAIENFEDNPLLQGLSENDEVALNLKFNKGVLLSGDLEASLTTQNRYALNAKNIGISKQIKGFSILSYNNIGNQLNDVQFNAEDFIQTLRKQTNENLLTPSYVGSSSLFSQMNNVSNNQFFGSLNILPKISETETLRINIDAFSDKKLELLESVTIIGGNNDSIIRIEQTNSNQSKPVYFDGRIKYQKFISSKKSWSSNFQFSKLRNDLSSIGVRNDIQQSESIQQKELFISNQTIYVYRLDERSALKFFGEFSFSEKFENLSLVPGINLDTDSIILGTTNLQNVQSSKRTFQLSGNYYKKFRKEDKFNLNLLFHQFSNNLDSDLIDIDGSSSGQNNIDYSVFLPGISMDYFFKQKKLSIRPVLKAKVYSYDYQEFNTNQSRTNSQFLYDTSVRFQYELNKRNSFSTSFGRLNEIPQEEYLYSNLILRSNRVIETNQFEFEKSTSDIININYRYYNLSKNADLNLGFSYESIRDKYLSFNNVNNDVLLLTNFFQDNTAENKIWNFSFTKYLSPLRSTIRLSAIQTNSKYFNFLNNSGLRLNRSNLTDIKLGIGTSFIGKFLFGNNLSINRNDFSTEGIQGFENTGVVNEFTISYVKSERIRISSNINYILPNIKDNSNKTIRLNGSINLVNKKKTINYSLNARNILNQSSLKRINNTDLSSSFSTESIFERLFLLTINFKY